jgi:hypothetical protein
VNLGQTGEIRFQRTIWPLVAAPGGAVIVMAAFDAVSRGSVRPGLEFLIVMAFMWAISLAAAAMFVLPILALVPRVRRPSLGVAAIWGAGAALAFWALFFGQPVVTTASPQAVGALAAAGAASGILYAVLVRRGGS